MKSYLTVLLLLVLVACEEVVDLDLKHRKQVCLNCVLNPDSLVELSLHYTRALDDNRPFTPVENATIILEEDGEQWAVADYDSAGVYRINRYPRIGHSYALRAEVPGADILRASTVVPSRPVIDTLITAVENLDYRDSNSELVRRESYKVEYTIRDALGDDYYWNYHLRYLTRDNRYELNNILVYFSPQADHFNRVRDSEVPPGFFYNYYIRQTDHGVDGMSWSFEKKMYSNYIDCFFNADEHYDRYMKSTMQVWSQDISEDIPIREPTQIYSNISNGTGIFGSMSQTIIDYRIF